ncbi:MAG: PKD domain-containing protein, partial [Bacteroidales bacterium]
MRSLYKVCLWLMVFIAISVIGIEHLTAQQHGLVKMNEQTLVVDLTEITSLSARSEVYDFFKSNMDFRIAPLSSASRLAISSSKMTQTELLRFYDATVQRIVEKDLVAGKDIQTNVLQSFASKYGYETSDRLMRGVLDTENDSCRNSLPFCTDLIYNFPAGVNSGSGESGPFYDCLGSTPNPAWYHMKIAIAGSLTIKMFSVPARDIDFILWGPFDDPSSPCVAALTANKVIDCSYSTAATEYCDIPNGILGKYYILLITNYSNQPCNITFQKTGGVGATDCTIVPPPIGSNSPVCYGESITFSADDFPGATYNWTGPNGWSSNQQNPVILNSVMEDAGEYSLVITVNGSQSDPISTNVIVNALPVPEFSANDVCFGETIVFVNESTTNPDSYFITSQLWNFGDFQTSALENPTHTYANPGTYLVTLTTYTGLFNCVETISHSVIVYDFPVVNAGEDQSIPNGWTTQLEGTITGGSGDVSYAWTPAEYLTDPNVL